MQLVSDHPSFAPGGSLAGSRKTQRANSQSLYVWIVLSLLAASTTLALYDLYLLMSAVAGGG